MWAPDVYEGAPTPITAYMAAAVKAAAFAGFLRVWLEAFSGVASSWHGPVWWLAAATMVVGNLVALAQKNIKRMLAYSSIAHAGYILVAVAIATPAATGHSCSTSLAYTLATFGAFGVIIALERNGGARLNIEDYAGSVDRSAVARDRDGGLHACAARISRSSVESDSSRSTGSSSPRFRRRCHRRSSRSSWSSRVSSPRATICMS